MTPYYGSSPYPLAFTLTADPSPFVSYSTVTSCSLAIQGLDLDPQVYAAVNIFSLPHGDGGA